MNIRNPCTDYKAKFRMFKSKKKFLKGLVLGLPYLTEKQREKWMGIMNVARQHGRPDEPFSGGFIHNNYGAGDWFRAPDKNGDWPTTETTLLSMYRYRHAAAMARQKQARYFCLDEITKADLEVFRLIEEAMSRSIEQLEEDYDTMISADKLIEEQNIGIM